VKREFTNTVLENGKKESNLTMMTENAEKATPMLANIEGLTKWFPVKRNKIFGKRTVHAVNGVSFSILKGQTIALVGESGSGKSTIARIILGLMKPTSGTIKWRDRDIFEMRADEKRQFRCEVQMVFQDPSSSLNPRKTIKNILSAPLRKHRIIGRKKLTHRVSELLSLVGIEPSYGLERYPHEFSGGQRQRIAIARAIALEPTLIVADEPVSSLDVSIQGQIINLLKGLQQEIGVNYFFITHDLALTRSIAQRVLVLYLGEIVEDGSIERIFQNPLHPYTKALMASTPVPNPRRSRKRRKVALRGEIPSPIDPPTGCFFHPRCAEAINECREVKPRLQLIDDRLVACHLK